MVKADAVTFDAKDLARGLQVRIKRAGEWTWRLRIAALLVRLAARIAWIDVELTSVEGTEKEITGSAGYHFWHACERFEDGETILVKPKIG